MLTYFLVKGTVTTYPYMGEPYKQDEYRLVKAEDLSDAYTKYCSYWEDQSDQYSVFYRVDAEVMETIE